MNQRLNVVVNVAILATLAFLLVSPSGPVGRIVTARYKHWQQRHEIAKVWSEAVDARSRLGTANGRRAQVVEFVDYQCPSCRRVAKQVEAAAEAGRATVVVRHLPLASIHPHAREAAKVAVCAEEQGFFAEAHALMLSDDGRSAVDQGDLSLLLDDMKTLSPERLGECMMDAATEHRLDSDIRLAKSLGVTGTPTFVSPKGVFVGADGWARVVASLELPADTPTEVPPKTVRRLADAALFDSRVHSATAISELGRLSDALYLESERLLLVDGLSLEAHLVDTRTGGFETIGGKGDGPGEYRSLFFGVIRTGEGFAAADLLAGRVNVYSRSGALLRTVAYDINSFNEPTARLVAVYDDGALLFRDGDPPRDAWPDGLHRATARYVDVDPSGVPRTVLELAGEEFWARDGAVLPVLFGYNVLEAQAGGRTVAVQTDSRVVQAYDRQGTVVAELPELPWSGPVSVTEAQVKLARAAKKDELSRKTGRSSPALLKMVYTTELAAVGDLPANQLAPTADALFEDLDGRLWIRSYVMPGDSIVRWHVLNFGEVFRDGFLLEVTMGEDVMDASGDRVVLRTADELGVERVVVRLMIPS